MKTRPMLFIFFALPTFALADACASGTVAALLAQSTCTIGVLTFDFTGYSDVEPNGTSGFREANVNFTPVSNGFELSGTFSASGSDNEGYGELYYTVTSSAGDLDGIASSVNGSTLSTSPSACCTDDSADATTYAANYLLAGDEYSDVYQYQFYGGSPSGGTYQNGTSLTATQSTSGGALIESDAYNEYYNSLGDLEIGGDGTASASFTSADFTFSEAPAVAPEPKSILLFATVALALIGTLRRRVLGNR